jgi:quercetin dioxygenase-like cupin family protein
MATIHRSVGDGRFGWPGVAVQRYEGENADRATKQVLIGRAEGKPSFNVRYFCVEAGGHTALDEHGHDHGVVVLHGRAEVLLGEEHHTVGPGDVVYIEPDEVHQFRTLGDEAFGFLCVVPPRPA